MTTGELPKDPRQECAPWLRDSRGAWDTAVRAWLADVGGHSLGALKAVEIVKERPWSAVYRVTFDTAVAYFKACATAGRHELPLLHWLGQQRHPGMPDLLAADMRQHWMLLADSGRLLQEVLSDADQVTVFPDLLAQYADVQVATIEQVDGLLALGVPDRRVERVPALLERLLAGDAAWVGRGAQEAATLRARARQLLPQLRETCAALGGTPYAAALDHGDLHRGNVAVRDGRCPPGCTLIDWGDACVTHPFTSLLVPLETTLQHVSPSEAPRWAGYLRDAYLEPWQRFGSRRQLLADVERALWLGQVIRALNMDHMFRGAPQAMLNRWRPLIFERLARWCRHYDESWTYASVHRA